MNVGESEVAALETVGQPRVVQPHQVEDRGLKVMDVHPVFDRVITQVVGRAVS